MKYPISRVILPRTLSSDCVNERINRRAKMVTELSLELRYKTHQMKIVVNILKKLSEKRGRDFVFLVSANGYRYILKLYPYKDIGTAPNETRILTLMTELFHKPRTFYGTDSKIVINKIRYYGLLFPFVEGVDLQEVIDRRLLSEYPVDHICDNILICLLSALDDLHARQIYHRDVKPSNIIMNMDSLLCRMIDFGIS